MVSVDSTRDKVCIIYVSFHLLLFLKKSLTNQADTNMGLCHELINIVSKIRILSSRVVLTNMLTL